MQDYSQKINMSQNKLSIQTFSRFSLVHQNYYSSSYIWILALGPALFSGSDMQWQRNLTSFICRVVFDCFYQTTISLCNFTSRSSDQLGWLLEPQHSPRTPRTVTRPSTEPCSTLLNFSVLMGTSRTRPSSSIALAFLDDKKQIF